jgi:hypothetical protein
MARTPQAQRSFRIWSRVVQTPKWLDGSICIPTLDAAASGAGYEVLPNEPDQISLKSI